MDIPLTMRQGKETAPLMTFPKTMFFPQKSRERVPILGENIQHRRILRMKNIKRDLFEIMDAAESNLPSAADATGLV